MRKLMLPTVFVAGLLLGALLLPRATPPAQALPPGLQASDNVVVDEKCHLRLTAGGRLYDQAGNPVAAPPYPPDAAWVNWPLTPLMSYGDTSTYVELRITNGRLQAVTSNGQVWNTGVAAQEDRQLIFAFNDLGVLKPPYAGFGEVVVLPAGAGTFNVTYTTPFPYTPVVTATTEGGGMPSVAHLTANTPAGCTLVTCVLPAGVPMSSADVNVTVTLGSP